MNRPGGLRIVITGSGRGIGAAIAERCAEEGNNVVINFLSNREAAKRTLARVEETCGAGILIRADVRDPSQVSFLTSKAVEAFGGIDVLINNAHSAFGLTSFDQIDWSAVQTQIDGTLKSSFLCVQELLPYLVKSEHAAILNVSTTTVIQPEEGFMHRNLAKAGLDQFTRSLAIELADRRIRVNSLAVGWTNTDQLNGIPMEVLEQNRVKIPMDRFADPSEIAEAAVFLISPRASFITGAVLPVDGGQCIGTH